jgi:hypothetical protein
MHIANKLLGRQHLNFEQLTPPEQELWSLFEKSDIFEFLTGQKDTVPQFENFLTFGATPKVNIDIQGLRKTCTQSYLHTIKEQFKELCQLLLKSHTSFMREKKKLTTKLSTLANKLSTTLNWQHKKRKENARR